MDNIIFPSLMRRQAPHRSAMRSLVEAITVSVLLILYISPSLEVHRPESALIQTGIVMTDFNYDQHYGGLHCGTRRRLGALKTEDKDATTSKPTYEPTLETTPKQFYTVPSLIPETAPKQYYVAPRSVLGADDYDDYLADDDVPQIQTRAFNGQKQYNTTEFNFAVLIRIKFGPRQQHHFCSGVLITDRHVLTAAHCLEKCQRGIFRSRTPPDGITMSIGEQYDRWDVDLKYRTSSIHVHSNYDPCKPNYEYDIAMLTTSEAVPVSEASNRVCLPPSSVNIYGIGQAIGFGFTSKTDKLPWRRLNSLEVVMNNDADCITKQPPFKADMICATAWDLNFCPGDSGGPLVVLRDGAWTLVGLNSITDSTTTDAAQCDGKGRKAKFVRISKLVRWIGETVERTA